MRNNQKRLSTPTSTDNLQPNTEVPPQAPTLEFIVPTEIVELPSKGLFYEEGHPLHNRTSVEIKHMTTKEEDLITNESLLKSGLAIDRLLQSVLVDPKMNINDMLMGDKNALVVACRIYGYGSEYETKFKCPECGETQKHVFDLSEIEDTNFEENAKEFNATFDYDNQMISLPIPRTKTKLELKLLKVDVAATTKKAKKKEAQNFSISKHYQKLIHSVNGNSDRQYVKAYIQSMSALDSRYMRGVYSKVVPGVDFACSFECDSCGHDDEVEVPLTADFFWPKS